MSLDMNLVALIDTMNERPIAFNKHYVELGCGITGALMLSQLVYWTKRTNDRNGWIYKTRNEWIEETGLTRREQETARARLIKLGFVSEMKRGVPCKVYFRVEYDKLYSALIELAQKRHSSRHESDLLVGRNRANCEGGNVPSITESTTKNTTESTTVKKQVKKSEPKKPVIKFDFKTALVEQSVSEELATEFMFVRKSKRATDTKRAFDRLMTEIGKTHFTVQQAIEYCLDRQKPWGAFEAEWYNNENKPQTFAKPQNQKPSRMAELEQLAQQEKAGHEHYDF